MLKKVSRRHNVLSSYIIDPNYDDIPDHIISNPTSIYDESLEVNRFMIVIVDLDKLDFEYQCAMYCFFYESYSIHHHKLISGSDGKHLIPLDSNPRPPTR